MGVPFQAHGAGYMLWVEDKAKYLGIWARSHNILKDNVSKKLSHSRPQLSEI